MTNTVGANSNVSRLTIAAFAGTVVIGGSNFVAIKFSNVELAPLYGAAVRFTAAAAIFAVLAKVLSLPFPRGRALLGNVLFGALTFGASYGFLYFALLEISAGMAAVVLAAVPLFTLLLASVHGQERLTPRGIGAGLLAVAGIGVLSLPSLGGDLPFVYVTAAVASAISSAEAAVLVKAFPRTHPVTTNAIGMVAGSLLLWVASLLAAESWTVPHQADTWLAVSWLIIVGSVALFYLFLLVIQRWTASATAYSLTLMPVVTVALGALLVREAITPETVVGATLVLLAVYVGAIRQSSGNRSALRTHPLRRRGGPRDRLAGKR